MSRGGMVVAGDVRGRWLAQARLRRATPACDPQSVESAKSVDDPILPIPVESA